MGLRFVLGSLLVAVLTVAGVVGVALTILHEELGHFRPKPVDRRIGEVLEPVAVGQPQCAPRASYREGTAIRHVAWRTKRVVPWVSNTLSGRLTNAQMLVVARSLIRVGR